DVFATIPPEICLQIYVQLRSKRCIWKLAQASPTVLQQCMASKAHITRTLLAANLDESMRQDAMAIILYPSLDIAEIDLYKTIVSKHVGLWAAQQLPDPFKEQDHKLITELDKLYSRLLFFIEDYITKATAIFPPREYLCLPNLPSTRQLIFKGLIIGNRFDATRLADLEWKRLLTAFLRYELICKIRHPHKRQYRLERRDFQPTEREAIRCVHQYLESLYGAMFAQCGESWLPKSPSTRQLLYPDNFYFCADAYASDMGLRSGWRTMAGALACYGFDLATTLLRSATAGRCGRDRLARWFRFCFEREYPDWECYMSYNGLFLDQGANEVEDDNYQLGPGLYRVLYPRISHTFFKSLQLGIYRQRAWVFFDDDRFYPVSSIQPHFPTSNELEEESDKITLDTEWF
ncbi:hypothetical protein B0T10DRAFT_581442, partial [Thelonectria olida]